MARLNLSGNELLASFSASELKRLTNAYFHAVSFEAGQTPAYADIRGLFIDVGLLIKNSGATGTC